MPRFAETSPSPVDARDYVARRDGASIRQSGRVIRDLVMQAAAAPATIALEFPDETILNVALFDYTERMVAHSAGRVGGQALGPRHQGHPVRRIEILGLIGRTRGTRIGDLRGFHISHRPASCKEEPMCWSNHRTEPGHGGRRRRQRRLPDPVAGEFPADGRRAVQQRDRPQSRRGAPG